jgi:uncharacterized membrane protein
MAKKDVKKNGKRHPLKKRSKVIRRKESTREIDTRLNQIIGMENRLLSEEKNIEKKEDTLSKGELLIESAETKIEKKENVLDNMEKDMHREEDDLEKLERLEKEIKHEVGEHPLAQISLKDIAKGLIGAFIGLAIHYTFVYGVEIAANLTMIRATVLFPVTFLVGLLFIYATGFRKIKDKKLLAFMPIRLFVLYVCSLIMSIVVLYLFYPQFGHGWEESYKMVAGVMLAAVVGACTADLLGKE